MTTRKSTTRLHSSDKIAVTAYDVGNRTFRPTEGYKVRPKHLPEFARVDPWAVTRTLERDGALGTRWVVTHMPTGTAIGMGEKTRDEAILRAVEVMAKRDAAAYEAAVAKARRTIAQAEPVAA
jgi:hypothetical protein